ncbi:precorrin-2 C20-methyltransferase [Methanocaldococcus infernus ME]|uniref:Precorrin-2 C20-methyltransferase n=1 Tax=Methanocaldococcus infernus (strain DSM 11812 / JCM 15783 / ME) TaxID=573063 RepID=D5VQD4_METIM|nr:precorrin-2 C(20)-methyltransferase [Methanocaldococcus infernus]ADG12787.1 precorrin-2 C20-methyltransferase [Methanocaldococcus infernus ME]
MVKKVYGVGIGIGGESLTLKALNILKKVDKIFIPISKRGKSSVAYELIKEYIKDKKVEELLFPMSKDKDELKKCWEENLKKILSEEGEVALITLGDPTLYSTFSYMWKSLREKGVEVEIVSGISSIFAAASLLNISLAEGEEKVCILPQGKDLDKYLDDFDTIIVMKTKNLENILKGLDRDDLTIYLAKRLGLEDEKITFGSPREINFNEFNDYLSLAIIKKERR